MRCVIFQILANHLVSAGIALSTTELTGPATHRLPNKLKKDGCAAGNCHRVALKDNAKTDHGQRLRTQVPGSKVPCGVAAWRATLCSGTCLHTWTIVSLRVTVLSQTAYLLNRFAHLRCRSDCRNVCIPSDSGALSWQTVKRVVPAAGRVLLAALFLFSGFDQTINF